MWNKFLKKSLVKKLISGIKIYISYLEAELFHNDN